MTLMELAEDYESWVRELAKDESMRGHREAAAFGWYLAEHIHQDQLALHNVPCTPAVA